MTEEIDRALEALTPVLVSELRALGCPLSSADTQDLLQEIRLRIFKALRDRGEKIKYLDAYAKKVVLTVFLNEAEKLGRRRGLIEAAGRLGAPIGGPESSAGPSEDLLEEEVAKAMAALAGTKRRAIELRFQGFTFAEIARLNGWSLRKTCGVCYRGLAELRARLAERGIRHEG
jgi:DNA-directed RNA polymerase specialized sigma24 family protein